MAGQVGLLTKNLITINNGDVTIITNFINRGAIDIYQELEDLRKEINNNLDVFQGRKVILAIKGPKALDILITTLLKNITKEICVFQASENRLYCINTIDGTVVPKESKLEKLEIELPLPTPL